MTYFVGWFGLALINTALANIDRRSPGKYFGGSLFLGPIVTLILATTREDSSGRLTAVRAFGTRPDPS